VLFEVSYTRTDWHVTEMLVFIFLGISMGIYGAIFCKLNILWAKTFRQLDLMKRFPIVEVLLVVLTTAVVGFYNPYTRLSGTSLVADLFSECDASKAGDGICPRTQGDILALVKLFSIALVIKSLLYLTEWHSD